MDAHLSRIFAKKLSISEEKVASAYHDALSEFVSHSSSKPDVKTKKNSGNKCMYKFALGKNSGNLCEKESKYELDEKFYCTTHYRSVKEKKDRSTKLKLKDTSVAQKTYEVKTSPLQKYETEKHNEHLVLKGTLLIVDKDKNCCLGKYTSDENEMTDKITRDEQETLEKLNIPYYPCTVLDVPEIDLEKDLEKSEAIKL